MTNETISAPRFIEVVTGKDKNQRKVLVNLQRINNIEVRTEQSGKRPSSSIRPVTGWNCRARPAQNCCGNWSRADIRRSPRSPRGG